MGLRGQRYWGFVVVGEYGGVLEVDGLGVGVLSSQLR